MKGTKGIYLALLTLLLSPMVADAGLIGDVVNFEFELTVGAPGTLPANVMGTATVTEAAGAEFPFGTFDIFIENDSVLVSWNIAAACGLVSENKYCNYYITGMDWLDNVTGVPLAGILGATVTNTIPGIVATNWGSNFVAWSFGPGGAAAGGQFLRFDLTVEPDSIPPAPDPDPQPTPVPEPGTLALLGLGLAGMSLRRRRKL